MKNWVIVSLAGGIISVDKVDRIASIFLPFMVVTVVWDGK